MSKRKEGFLSSRKKESKIEIAILQVMQGNIENSFTRHVRIRWPGGDVTCTQMAMGQMTSSMRDT